jgi:hypothetical protein
MRATEVKDSSLTTSLPPVQLGMPGLGIFPERMSSVTGGCCLGAKVERGGKADEKWEA